MHEFYLVITLLSSGKKKSCWQKLHLWLFSYQWFYNGAGCGNVSLIELLVAK